MSNKYLLLHLFLPHLFLLWDKKDAREGVRISYLKPVSEKAKYNYRLCKIKKLVHVCLLERSAMIYQLLQRAKSTIIMRK